VPPETVFGAAKFSRIIRKIRLLVKANFFNPKRRIESMAKLIEGDRVRHSGSFLRQIGCFTGEVPQMRGTLVGFKVVGKRELAVVHWEGDEETKLVGPGTLEKCRA
jgi:hypothetical protein